MLRPTQQGTEDSEIRDRRMRTKIIAEVAQGYEGKAEYCELYVKAAAKAGATAVKFQIVYADDTAEPGYEYYDFYKTLEIDVSVWQGIRRLADELGVLFFTDVSGDRAMKIAEAIRPDGIKINSSNFFNRALIRRAFDLADRLLISLGGVEEGEIDALLKEVEDWGGVDKLVLLYGFQAEPTPIEKSNLSRLPLLKRRFPGIEIGYMDHAPGESDDQTHLSLIAMALGADWIEKHLTLSRYLEVEDYVSALEPDEFAVYVATLERLDAAFGPEDMTLSDEERAYRDKAVKKIVAAQDLATGRLLSFEDIAFKRTPRIPPFEGFHDPASLLGRTLSKSVGRGDPITKDCLA